MTPNIEDSEVTKLKLQLQEEYKIRKILISELGNLYGFWKLYNFLRKIKTYLHERDKLRYKIDSFIGKYLKNKDEITPFPDTFNNAYKNKIIKYTFFLDKRNNRKCDIEAIESILADNSDKKIIVYPQTVYWEPFQRPQQLLREFGKKGYLCFFCEPEKPRLYIQQVSENVYTVSGERYLIYPLKNIKVITLCTWMLNLPFINLIENKFIWYDLIDRLDLFSLYDDDMLTLHNQLVLCADLVTYSGIELINMVSSRKDAVYLPNGVVVEDFTLPNEIDLSIAEKVNQIFKPMTKPIIGFYGSIAEWLDLELIKDLAFLRQDWSFVFIGKIWMNINSIKDILNIHLLGLIPYHELPYYAKNFDVAIIPFLVNQITNSVSPIKLFEYAALGKPVVATPFLEITQYQEQSFIRLAKNAAEFAEKIDELLEMPPGVMEAEARLFAVKNQWRERVSMIESRITL